MPLATDFASFGTIGVPLFNNPGTGNSAQWAGLTLCNIGPFQKPISSDFTTSNFSTRTVADLTDRLVLTTPSGSNSIGSLLKPLATTPYTIDLIGAVHFIDIVNSDGPIFCMSLADSGAGPLMCTFGIYVTFLTANNSIGINVLAQHRTSPTVNSANVAFAAGSFNMGYIALRLTDDGTTRRFNVSSTGKDYQQIFSEATNTFVTPTQCGFGTYSPTIGQSTKFSIYHFKVSNAILGDAP